MKKLASELEFICQIKRDGSGTKKVPKSYLKAIKENELMSRELYELQPLSLTEKTYIAFNINVFVVRLK